MIPEIDPAELNAWRRNPARAAPLIVDVREPWEFARCSIDGSVSVPLQELPRRLSELDAKREMVLVCHHGARSRNAAMWLSQNGFPAVHNLRGGVEAWAVEVDPAMPRY